MVVGMITPMLAASSRLSVVARVMTRPSSALLYNNQAITPSRPPHTRPLISATPTSFLSRRLPLSWLIWPTAMARTIMVMVWLPELPPMPATMGISAARATSFSMAPSKTPMTREAMKAVTRLTASQAQRLRTESSTGAKMSSSSRRPAWLSSSTSDSSRM